jgi:hypothetical protein
MSFESDIRIVYLKLLRREPSADEISQSFDKDIFFLEQEIKESNEYKLTKGYFFADSFYDVSNNTYSFSNVINDRNKKGIYLGNDYLNLNILLYDKSVENKVSDNFKYYDFKDITNIQFSWGEPLHQTHTLYLNDAYLKHQLEYENAQISIEKYCLHSFKTCFLQKVSINASISSTIDINHLFDSEMSSYVLYYKSQSINFLEVHEEDVVITNMYLCNNQDFLHNGQNTSANSFTVPLMANEERIFYVYTSILHKDNISEHNSKEILLNLLNYSDLEIISGHKTCWDKRWYKRYDFELREYISKRQEFEKLIFNFHYSLYKLYSNIYVNDLVYSIPNLLVLDPELALKVIQSYIYYMRNDYNTAKYYSRDGKFLTFQKNNIGLQINQSALLNIHIWIYYVVSKNINWFLTEGYPTMLMNAQFLMNCIRDDSISNSLSFDGFQQTNNAFTIHITKMALNMTTVAQYEFIIFRVFDGATDKEIDAEEFTFTTGLYVQYMNLGYKSVSDSSIEVRCEKINNMFCYTFYTSLDELIGYKFSEQYGYQLELGLNREITFNLDESIAQKPILFYDTNGFIIRHKYSNNVDETLLSNVNVLSTDDSITINTNDVKSYSCLTIDVYKNDFNTLYGDNAFITEHGLTSNNVIVPFSNYTDTYNSDTVAEIFTVLTNFYDNKNFYNVEENVSFYGSDDSSNVQNRLLQSGMMLKLGQQTSNYKVRQTLMNTYKEVLFDLNKDSVLGEDQHNNIIVYNMLYNLLGFKFNAQGLIYESSNVFPEEIDKISIRYNHSYDNFTNVLQQSYTFLNLEDVITIDFKYNEMKEYVQIVVDILPVYPIYSLNDVEIYVDDVERDESFFTTESKINKIYYSQTTDSFDTLTYIQELTNQYIHLKLDNGVISNYFVKYFDEITDTYGSDMLYPTLNAHLSFEDKCTFNLEIVFNSQTFNRYELFNSLNINLNYEDDLLDIVSETDPYGFETNSNCIISYDNSNIFNIIYNENDKAGSVVIGNLKLELIEFDVFSRITPLFPLNGTVVVEGITKNILFDKTNYPPIVRELAKDYKYNIDTYVIENEDVISLLYDEIVLPVEHVLSSGNNVYEQLGHGDVDPTLNSGNLIRINENIKTNLRHLNNANELNAFLDSKNAKLLDITCSDYSTLFRIIENDVVELYGIGKNSNDALMVNDISNTDVISITRCDKFHNFLNTNQYNIEDFNIIQTVSSTMLYSKDYVYAIGNNENYNLGIDTTQSTEIVESVQIINLIKEENSRINKIILNNSSTIIYLDNNNVYGLGESVMFKYLTTISSSIWLPTPTELDVINNFVNINDYVIERIEGGSLHLKFLLVSLKTLEKEWWGVGRNRFNSMGLTPHITEDDYDVDIKHMVRLNQIEAFIHGNKFDESYTGPSAKNANKVNLIPNYGISTYHTAIYDEETRDIYVLGALSLNESESEITTITQWTKWISKEDIVSISGSSDYKIILSMLNSQGIFIGLSKEDKQYMKKHKSEHIQCLVVNSGDNYVLHMGNTTINLLMGSIILHNSMDLTSLEYDYRFEIEYRNSVKLFLDNIEFQFENEDYTEYKLYIRLYVLEGHYIFEGKRNVYSDVIDISFQLEHNNMYKISTQNSYTVNTSATTYVEFEKKIILENRLIFRNLVSSLV